MAKFKPVVRYQGADGYYHVYIRVTHNRKVAYMKTNKVVNQKGIAKDKSVTDTFVLQYCMNLIAKYIEQLNKKDDSLWTVDEVVSFLKNGNADICFSDYARKYIDGLYNNGQERNSRNYELALQSLELYAGTNKVMFSHLTSTLCNGWIKYLTERTARAVGGSGAVKNAGRSSPHRFLRLIEYILFPNWGGMSP